MPSFLLFIYKLIVLLKIQQFLTLKNINYILNVCLPADGQLGDSWHFRLWAKLSFSEVDRFLAEVCGACDGSGIFNYSECGIDGLQTET